MLQDTALVTLRRLNAQFIHNFVTCNVASQASVIHPRFTCIMPNGQRLERDAYLAYWATGFDPDIITYWDYRDERIEIFGDVALVCASNGYTRRRDGVAQSGMSIYTDTYLREDGRWSCIQAMITGMQPDFFPSDDSVVRRYHRGRLQE